jgi:hypothetical protein
MGFAFWFGSEYGTTFASDPLAGSGGIVCRDAAPDGSGSPLLGHGAFSRIDGAPRHLSASQQKEMQRAVRDKTPTAASSSSTAGDGISGQTPASSSSSSSSWTLPEEVQDFIGGIARVSRRDFLATFDDGLPADEDSPGNQEVLMFYDSKGSLPRSFRANLQPYGSAAEATENCRYMRVISVDPERDDAVCLAIQGNNAEPHYHVHKWLQDPKDGTFRQVSRYRTALDDDDKASDVRRSKELAAMADPPEPAIVNAANKVLQHYLAHYGTVGKRFNSVLARVAKSNTVVATVCNVGNVDLLRNFVCAARLHNALPTNMVVVAMDKATHEIVSKDLNITSFYHPLLFASIQDLSIATSDADGGTMEYAQLMLAKLFVPHMITDAGYNLLFHDVDMVPYRDYYTHMVETVAPTYPDFELYVSYDFTDDDRYAPWGANSGLWYARSTERTRYLFSLLLRRAALVLKTRSHQAAMCVVLSDVANQYGLRVKVLDKHGRDFPGTNLSSSALEFGFALTVFSLHPPARPLTHSLAHYPPSAVEHHFHHDWDYMKQLMRGEATPYLLHMNGKHHRADTKVEFLEQMGAWFVDPSSKDKCVADPQPVCHYKDKPSKIPCRRSPTLESGASFW